MRLSRVVECAMLGCMAWAVIRQDVHGVIVFMLGAIYARQHHNTP